MTLKYSCFISYPHGRTDFTTTFIEQLTETLESYLDPLLDLDDLGVYVDRRRLEPGYLYNEALAEAICQSICMIVVYSPKYRRRSYCLREYAAMERLEQRRREILGDRTENELGMIIPIIFRGEVKKLPAKIRERRHYCDFSKFTTASTNISQNEEYVKEIEKIAQIVYRHYENFENLAESAFGPCDAFELPSEEEVERAWRGSSGRPDQGFPGRAME